MVGKSTLGFWTTMSRSISELWSYIHHTHRRITRLPRELLSLSWS